MPSEFIDIIAIVAGTVLVPGLCLLALARFGFSHVSLVRQRAERRAVSVLGWALVALASAFLLYLLVLLGAARGGGGLGSMGNPIGAIVIAVYVFVVAPLSVSAFVVAVGNYFVSRYRATRRDPR